MGQRQGTSLPRHVTVVLATIAALSLVACMPVFRRGGPLVGRRVLVVQALDRSDQGAGMPIANALAQALQTAGVHVVGVVRRPGAALSPAWLHAEARLWQARSVVTATVSAWNLQSGQHRAFVAMTGLSMGLDGNIEWAQREIATAPWPGPFLAKSVIAAAEIPAATPQDGRQALHVASLRAAKEFVVDLASHFSP